MINSERLLSRFLRYVRVDTTANDQTDRYPSSDGQFELGRMLAKELQAMGISDVEITPQGLVYATIPANQTAACPVVAFNSHLDTSPETTGANVNPQVIRDYDGEDIVLPGDPSRVIRTSENAELKSLVGKTLITSDGTTLLGGDDKAGLAIIMELAEHLQESPDVAHGDIRILFTCDEEIGRGVDHVDLTKLNAQVCYTFDGPAAGHIDVETFSADLVRITVQGVNIHPAIAKDRMVNAVRIAAALIDGLPRDRLAPETTTGREGFLHPYWLEGGVAEVHLNVLLRDFDTANLDHHANVLSKLAERVEAEFPGSTIQLDRTAQYRNLGDGLAKEPRAVAFAEAAHQICGHPCRQSIIRGGTDGSRLTELGLPTPNLSSGQHNPHSPLEWACLEEMVSAVEIGTELVQQWSRASL